MKFSYLKDGFDNFKVDCEVVIVSSQKDIVDKDALELLGFKCESFNIAFLPHIHRIYVGVDKLNSNDSRIALALAVEKIKNTKYKSMKVKIDDIKILKAVVEGIILGSYSFDKYKSKKTILNLDSVFIGINEKFSQKEIDDTIFEAIILANSTNKARDVVNSIPNDIYPNKLADIALDVVKDLDDVECKVYDEKFLKQEGMNAFYAVGKASIHPPRLIHLTYKPKNAIKKIAFVGKGLTYDSGGLSLKPSDSMLTMKLDKSGAIAALYILEAIAKLKLPFEVHSIMGAAENMIGSSAYKPDDVLIAKNGTSIEVRNTDAEGRLVLADCLCYAQELEPDFIIDIATLTGACVVALGEYTFGVMGHNKKLKSSIIKGAKKAGELAAPLEFNNYLKGKLKSNVADISNVSSTRYGGAITAALFLDNFIKEKNKDKWIHLDIAGPAYNESAWGYNQVGASGVGVRTCVEWVKSLS